MLDDKEGRREAHNSHCAHHKEQAANGKLQNIFVPDCFQEADLRRTGTVLPHGRRNLIGDENDPDYEHDHAVANREPPCGRNVLRRCNAGNKIIHDELCNGAARDVNAVCPSAKLRRKEARNNIGAENTGCAGACADDQLRQEHNRVAFRAEHADQRACDDQDHRKNAGSARADFSHHYAEWDSEKNTQDAQRGHQHAGLSFIDLHALHHVCQNRLEPVLTEAGRQI